MAEADRAVVVWVAAEILPHDAQVRAWLRRAFPNQTEIDDVMQEAYWRLSTLQDVSHISNPRAYLYQTARNVVLDQMRRARVVRLDALTDVDLDTLPDETPSPERIVGGRRELAQVQRLMEALPERCRRVLELRKIHGLSQREIAQQLGISENVVENNVTRGLRIILQTLADRDAAPKRRALSKVNIRSSRERH